MVIELAIGPDQTAGTFRVEVLRSPAGEAAAVIALDVDGLAARREQLEQAVLASAVASRAILPPTERLVRGVGETLFEALMGSGEVAGRYRASAALAAERGQGLRVVLRIDTPTLAGLPWEAMYDADVGAYVCRRDQLVRQVPVAAVAPPLTVRPPLRILGIVSSPRGLAQLDAEKEREQLARALARPLGNGLIDLQWAPEATWATLEDLLLIHEWHALHFIGHGDYDADRDEGVLALVGDDGRANFIEADRLVDLLHQARPMPRLVILNSCAGAAGGANDLFSGTAAALVRGGVSAVAAMQYQISDTAAVAFARGFYAAISHGRGVDDATASGRVAIIGTRARTLEWVTPVTYLRGHDSRLFILPSTSSPGGGISTERRSPQSTGVYDEGGANESFRALGAGSLSDSNPDQKDVVARRMAEAEFRTDAIQGQVAALERLLIERNRSLSSERRRIDGIYQANGPEAFVTMLQLALATSHYPDGLRGSCAATYRTETRELLVEYELPPREVVPDVAAYRYVKAANFVQSEPRGQGDVEKLYARLLARVTLRTLAEAFDVTSAELVNEILFNGYVSTRDRATGNQIRPCLVSIHVARSTFAKIILDEPQLDPIACLTHLSAVVSPHPYDLEAIHPIGRFDLSKYKFIEEMDVVAHLGSQPDLLALRPVEFEHLIRRLFEAIGLKSWVTQQSRDTGIDVIAYDDDPIVGGLYIIQAKRYSSIVGVEQLRALAGAIEDNRAVKGVLVTTSWVGKAGRDFVSRNGRIEIVEGTQLKAMLKEHLGLDVVINLSKPTAR
jgi:restriction system protein